MSPVKAAIYTRISDDREGTALGVARQEQDCRQLADRLGWEVAAVYSDNDISAYSGARRPGYDALCAAIERRDVRGVITWHPDRLHRSPRQLEGFIDLVEATKAKVQTVQAGEWDLSTPTGRAVARTMGAWSRHESEHKGERVRRKMQERAAHGLPHGGSHRPFGYEADRVTVNRAEAKVVREIASRVLAGEALTAITRDLNERGVPTVSGKRWSNGTVRGIAINPRYGGLRAVGKGARREIVGPAVWEQILDRDKHHALVTLLTDPSRRRNRGTARRNLLAGLLWCGRCGHRLLAHPRRKRLANGDVSVTRTYTCVRDAAKATHADACGRLRIGAHDLETYIVDGVLEWADDHADGIAERAAAVEDRSADEAERAELEQRKLQLSADWADGLLDRAEWRVAKERIDAKLAALHVDEAAALRRRATSAHLDGLPARWAKSEDRGGLTFDERRAVLADVIERIEIMPAGPGVHGFDPDRVKVAFR
jgi:site-specific DNA recombinase